MARASSAKAEGSTSARGGSAKADVVQDAAPDDGAGLADLQQDVRLAEARLITRSMLQELRTLALQHPGRN